MLLDCDALIGLANRSHCMCFSGKVVRNFSGGRPDDAFDQIVGAPEAAVIKVEGLGGNPVAFVVLDAAHEDRFVAFMSSIVACTAFRVASFAPAPNGVFRTRSLSYPPSSRFGSFSPLAISLA